VSSLSNPRSPHECHEALKSHNPLYSSLTVTQWPSWVHSPSSYDVGSISSLSVAFEDPDGGKLRALLAERYLYIYGTRASIKKWKQRQNKNKDNSKSQAAEQPQDGNESSNDEDIEFTLTTPSAKPPATPTANPSPSTPTSHFTLLPDQPPNPNSPFRPPPPQHAPTNPSLKHKIQSSAALIVLGGKCDHPSSRPGVPISAKKLPGLCHRHSTIPHSHLCTITKGNFGGRYKMDEVP
jgi:hypothetical protein